MSQEWLKKLAELSNDKDLVKRAQQMQARVASAPKPRPAAGGPRRGLFGAAFGSFFRYLLLFAALQAAAMIVVAGLEGLEDEPWGLIYHHAVWYPLTQPILPEPVYGVLREWIGVTPDDLLALYERINGFVQEWQDALVFLTPVAAALALTLFFLPSINARRRRSPIRLVIFLANLAVLVLIAEMRLGVIVIWLAAFVFSFVGGGRAFTVPKAQAPAGTPRPSDAKPSVRSATAPRTAPATRAAGAGQSATGMQQRATRESRSSSRDAVVARQIGTGGSWIRAR